MAKITHATPTVQVDFSKEQLTPAAGAIFVAKMAEKLGLEGLLRKHVQVKRRQRGYEDVDFLLPLIYNLACGETALLDLERLRCDSARKQATAVLNVPSSRTYSEYLMKFTDAHIDGLQQVAAPVVSALLPGVVAHELALQGFISVFPDGTGLEVDGRYIENKAMGYDGKDKLWLHQVYIGKLWVHQSLQAGNVHAASGWKEGLQATYNALQSALCVSNAHPIDTGKAPVWMRADNAYYNKEVVEQCQQWGWNYSISVTSGTYKGPILRQTHALPESSWTAIMDDNTEHATVVSHQPAEWKTPQSYLVVRTLLPKTAQIPLLNARKYAYTVILVSDTGPSLRKAVQRHRQKQGHENVQKGPLEALDLHHPPCLGEHANRAFYLCGQLAQNLLIGLQMQALPASARKHSLSTLIRDLCRVVGRWVCHGRRPMLRFAQCTLRPHWIAAAARYFGMWGCGPTSTDPPTL